MQDSLSARLSDLLGRSNPKGIYAITGTPITNRPINFFNILNLNEIYGFYLEGHAGGHIGLYLKTLNKYKFHYIHYNMDDFFIFFKVTY